MSTTITLSKETKEMLQKLKGNKTWDEFLLELALKEQRTRMEKALKKLREIPWVEEGIKLKLKLKKF